MLTLCVGVLLFSCFARAQESSMKATQQTPTFRADSNLVLLDAMVRDRKTGDLITDLTKDDFRVEDDGVPQEIDYLSHDQLPLSLVFLIDDGDTMKANHKPSKFNVGWLADCANGALAALTALRPGDEVAVMTFSSSTQLIQPFTTNRQAMADAVRLAADKRDSDTDFVDEDVYEAVGVALQATIPGSRRVLVFFTDDTSNYVNWLTRKAAGKHAPAQMHNHKEALQRLMQTGVSVSGLVDRSSLENGMIATAAANPLSLVELDDVQHFAAQTGSPIVKAHGKDVAPKVTTLIEEIRNRYTIGYVPTGPQVPGTFHRIKVTLTRNAFQTHRDLQHDHATVEARSGYYIWIK